MGKGILCIRTVCAVLAGAACVLCTHPVAALAGSATNLSDQSRTGWYPDESSLSPDIVAGSGFGQRFSAAVSGQVYAQPLLSQGTLFVATEQNRIYGLDPVTGAVNWSRQVDPPWNASDIGCQDLTPTIGVTGTPVIDPATGIAYFFSKTYASGGAGPAQWDVHAVDVRTGAEQAGFPRAVSGTADNDPSQVFDATQQMQRPGLLLIDGVVYAAFGGHCDLAPYQGWVVGVSTAGQIRAMWVDESGSDTGGGIWQSGGGLVSDRDRQLIVATGNGHSPQPPIVGTSPPGGLGDSVVRLAAGSDGRLAATDFFAPFNGAQLDTSDLDLGSAAPALLPSRYFGTPAVPHLLVTAGKEGFVYLLNADDLGGSGEGANGSDRVVYRLGPYGGVWSHPAVWPGDGGYVYMPTASLPPSEVSGTLRVYRYGEDGGGGPALALAGTSSEPFGFGSSIPVVTSNGTSSGSALVWAIASPDSTGAGAQLRAYDALPANGRPTLRFSAPIGQASKFTPPGVAAGRLYVGTRDGHVLAFGASQQPAVTGSSDSTPATAVGSSTATTETISATETATITGISSSGASFTSGTSVPALPAHLLAGDSVGVPITFTPATAGPQTGTLTVNLGTGGPVTIPLSGNGLDAGARIASAQPDVAFNDLAPGGLASAGVTFQNVGSAPLAIQRVEQPADPFAATGLPAPGTTIAAGRSLIVNVTFAPTATGSYLDSIALDTTGGQARVHLSGRATPPARLQLAPQALAYQSVPVGSATSESFSLSNSGGSPLTITSSNPPGGGQFSALTTLDDGTTIPAGGVVTETVRFAPATAGAFADAWQISGDDGSGPHTVSLAGSALAAQLVPLDVGPLFGIPRLGDLHVLPSRFRAGRHQPGALVRYELSQGAVVRFAVEAARSERCRSKLGAHRRCTRYVPLPGNFRKTGHPGVNVIHFSGWIDRRFLRPGDYRLAATPLTGDSRPLMSRTVAFTIR